MAVTTGAKPYNNMIRRYLPNIAQLRQILQATVIADNTTGDSTAVAAAAGFGVQEWRFSHTFIGGTSAVEPVTAWTPGYKFKILSWSAVVDVLLVGSGGSRVFNMEIGTTDVGTTPSTLTLAEANATLGTVVAGTAVAGANTGTASDTFSIELASGGTAFSAGKISMIIKVQNMDTADAYAALLAKLKTAKLMATA